MPDWNALIRVIPDELGAWDIEIDRDTWRALIEDLDEVLYGQDDDEEEEEEDETLLMRPWTPQETDEERAAREAQHRRREAAFPIGVSDQAKRFWLTFGVLAHFWWSGVRVRSSQERDAEVGPGWRGRTSGA